MDLDAPWNTKEGVSKSSKLSGLDVARAAPSGVVTKSSQSEQPRVCIWRLVLNRPGSAWERFLSKGVTTLGQGSEQGSDNARTGGGDKGVLWCCGGCAWAFQDPKLRAPRCLVPCRTQCGRLHYKCHLRAYPHTGGHSILDTATC
jgi:hypothetical protein